MGVEIPEHGVECGNVTVADGVGAGVHGDCGEVGLAREALNGIEHGRRWGCGW